MNSFKELSFNEQKISSVTVGCYYNGLSPDMNVQCVHLNGRSKIAQELNFE